MRRATQYTATPRHPQWIDLSEQHLAVRERLQRSLARFAQGEGAPVPSIVGAYGSGKSELMAWGFRHCWCELGVPAFVLNAESLLKRLPSSMSPTQFSVEVAAYVQGQLALLDKQLEGTDPEGLHLATDMRPGESALTYLRELFDDRTLSPEMIRALLQAGRGVLFIDEIEQQYSELLDRVEANDRAPLREMLQRLGNGQENYYVVLSFGLTSAYEAIGGADARRMDTLTLPIPEPAELGQFANLDGYGNFIWWASRGRPGWAAKLANDWGNGIAEAKTLERFAELQPSSIENLPLIDVSSLPVALRTQRVNELVTQLLKSLGPVAWSDLHFSVKPDGRDVLPHNLVLIVRAEDELTPVATLVDCFISDLIDLADQLQAPVTDPAQLRRYLSRVFSAMADEQGRIVFGGPRKTEFLAQGVVAPTLILVQDLILEFEGDREATLGVLNLLDRVMNHVGIVGDHVHDIFDLVREFPRTEECFVETRERSDESWVSLAPKAVESFFPRLVGRPLLTLMPDTQPTLERQRAELVGEVKNGALRLHVDIQHESTSVRFVFVPAASCLRTIHENDFNRNRRRHYLADGQMFVLVDLADEDGDHLLREIYQDDVRILEHLQKLQSVTLPEKRLRDFLTSLWHNLLQADVLNADVTNEETVSLTEALDVVRSRANLTKSDRRKLEYYEQRLEQTLTSMAIASARAHLGRKRLLFSPGQPGFPDKRIDDALSGVRESRAIEQIGLSLDLLTDYETTVDWLVELRGLENLRKLTRQPSAYNEFLEAYTVTTRPREPGTSLKDLYAYMQTQGGFDELRSAASRLGLQPPAHYEAANEATNEAPLLYLYDKLTTSERTFIKAISFYTYLDSNHSEHVRYLDGLSGDIGQIWERLANLAKNVAEFNQELNHDLLDCSEIEAFQDEVNRLMQLLDRRDQLPPMLTYIAYRFVGSAASGLQEKWQRWASEQGLEGWRTKLRELRNWPATVCAIEDEVNDLFAANQTLKTDILGAPQTTLTKLRRQLEVGAASVLDGLQTDNELASAERFRGDTLPYEAAKSRAREHLDELHRQASTIDSLIDGIDELQSTINEAIARLGESHDKQ